MQAKTQLMIWLVMIKTVKLHQIELNDDDVGAGLSWGSHIKTAAMITAESFK